MQNIYPVNGLPFWNAAEIFERNYLAQVFAMSMNEFLTAENAAWHLHQIEAPCLTPIELINPNYTDRDVFIAGGDNRIVKSLNTFVMRPETTPGSYAYIQHLLDSQKDKPPFVVWQMGKSWRKEQDQATKNMRLKEFYQQEFQCVYADDTKNDYMAAILPQLSKIFCLMLGRQTRIVESDRLPSYSLKTMDIEVELPHKAGENKIRWMEVASISLRKDFKGVFTYTTGKGKGTKNLLVLEVSIGLDRMVYAKFLPPQEDDGEN